MISNLPWELLGAVVGAGLASGKEIASFFARYGAWGYAGILLAVAVMTSLAGTRFHETLASSFLGRLWRLLLTMLLIVTGGAMLGGAGHIGALLLPFRHAYGIAFSGTLALSFCLAKYTRQGLAWTSRLLLLALFGVLVSGLFISPMQAVRLDVPNVSQALLRGMCYGGFNAALQQPILSAVGDDRAARQRAQKISGGMLMGILLLGSMVLLRHPALIGEAMPFVTLTAQLGKTGYWLCCLCMYCAILSTATACIRSIHGDWRCVLLMALTGLVGFEGVVSRVYPLLGGACMMLLAAAKILNSRISFR